MLIAHAAGLFNSTYHIAIAVAIYSIYTDVNIDSLIVRIFILHA